jgi:hypothetical protein
VVIVAALRPAEILQAADARGDLRVIGDHRASLARGDDLQGAEGKDAREGSQA